jgi:hypothetical protein
MKPTATFAACCTVLILSLASARAGIAFPDPSGGWSYIYNGNQLIVGAPLSGLTSLDGTWGHDSSDQWDGSEIGGAFSTGDFGIGNAPGGVSLVTNQTGTTYLRLQDPGDPTTYGYPDPSNRKLFFGHDVTTDIDPTKAQTIMDAGVTLSFRARIPTLAKAGGPLDSLTPAGQTASGMQPYPTNGDGYVVSDGGKGNFVIRQGGSGLESPGGAIAFCLTQNTDAASADPGAPQAGTAGLTFNEFNGNVPIHTVAFGQGKRADAVEFDPTDWHEVYIVMRKDPDNFGTHEIFVFVDGNLRADVFKTTAGTGADTFSSTYIAMGGSATPQSWALDVDWFGYRDEQVFPPGALLPPVIYGFSPEKGTKSFPATSNFNFSVSARMTTNTLPASGFKLSLNGQDVSSQLVLTGSDSSTNRMATFTSLQPNTIYTGTVIVTDSGRLSTTNAVTFDTMILITAKANAEGMIVLEWNTGTLVSADTVNGSYQPVNGATSPYTVNPADAAQRFYRVRIP